MIEVGGVKLLAAEELSGAGLRAGMQVALNECVSGSVVSDSATPCTVACPALPSMGFSRQEYWRGLPLQGIFPTQGSNPGLLHCRQILYHLSHREAPWVGVGGRQKC